MLLRCQKVNFRLARQLPPAKVNLREAELKDEEMKFPVALEHLDPTEPEDEPPLDFLITRGRKLELCLQPGDLT